jgi:hypothetical protein
MKALDMTLTPSEIKDTLLATAIDGQLNLVDALYEVKAR